MSKKIKPKLFVRVGQQFTRLTVLEKLPIHISPCGSKKSRWRCLCSCGKIIEVNGGDLTGGNSKSCGCRQKDKAKKTVGVAYLNYLLLKYKTSAKNRGLAFNLTKKQFKNIIIQNCFYCNQSPTPAAEYQIKVRNGTFSHNGIDRIDNSAGYLLDNCVPCCSTCNYMKHSSSYEEFLNKIKRIALQHCI